jgi:hypothetical protein
MVSDVVPENYIELRLDFVGKEDNYPDEIKRAAGPAGITILNGLEQSRRRSK